MPWFERPSAISSRICALTLRQLRERVAEPATLDELLDDHPVDDAFAGGHPADRVDQLVDPPDALLQQVADPATASAR